MKRGMASLAAVAILMWGAAACGEDTVVVEKEPLRARTLAGFVDAGPESSGALVEECEKNWGEISSVTTTDAYGHFALPQSHNARTHYLRVTLNSGKKLLLKVKLTKSGPPELAVPAGEMGIAGWR